MSATMTKDKTEGSRVIVDPELLPGWGAKEIAVLPLLFDQLLLPEPSLTNLDRWGLDRKRVATLTEHGIVLPVTVANAPLSIYPSDLQITRADLLPDPEFQRLYQDAVEFDLNDQELEGVRMRVEEGFDRALPLDIVAFNLNWDFLVSMCLGAPVASSHLTGPLWSYKLGLVGLASVANDLSADAASELESFFTTYSLRLPSSLSIDELLELRRDSVARKFRDWFSGVVALARKREQTSGIRVNEQVTREFTDLLERRSARIDRAGDAITALFAVGVGSIVGVPEGVAAVLLNPVFRRLARRAASLWGAQRWIDVVVSLR